ncbi:MAG: hypothetical protein NUV60_00075 [Patescibacteria group bacterium]|nr:hypothetical protein [Patescibacteria group bacterium]
MEDEKTLAPGERFVPPAVSPTKPPVVQAPQAPAPTYAPSNLPGIPTPAQQQWGVVISIIIIVLMIIIGAFYAWGQRIAQNQVPAALGQ